MDMNNPQTLKDWRDSLTEEELQEYCNQQAIKLRDEIDGWLIQTYNDGNEDRKKCGLPELDFDGYEIPIKSQ